MFYILTCLQHVMIMGCYYNNGMFSPPTGTRGFLNTSVIVGITIVIFLAGALAGALLLYCISKYRSQSSKPGLSSHQQQQEGPVYDEVPASCGNKKIELRENIAYGPVL